MASFYVTMSDSLTQHLGKDLNLTRDIGLQSFAELWGTRLAFKDKYLEMSDALESKKKVLFAKRKTERWGVEDQAFLAQNKELFTTDYKAAAKVMLPADTAHVESARLIFQYLTN